MVYNPILTSKLHFLKYLGSMLTDCHETSLTGILLIRQLKWGAKPYAYFTTAHFVEYLSSMLMDFHETSITGILLFRLLKISCIWKTFCIILCFLHSIFMHIIYIHACIYVNVSDNYPSVPNAVLKSMCMLYLSPSLCYIDSLCNWHMSLKRSDEVCNILSK